VAENDRGLGPPRVRIGVFGPAAGQQGAGLDQLLDHRRVGGPEPAGLLALGLDDLQPGEKRHVLVVRAVRVDRVGHLMIAVAEPASADEARLDVSHSHCRMAFSPAIANEITRQICAPPARTACAAVSVRTYSASRAAHSTRPPAVYGITPARAELLVDKLKN